MTDYPAIQLSRYEWRRIRNGHPWIYAKSLQKVPDSLATGDVVKVLGAKEEFIGTGIYNEVSKIKIRILSREDELIDRRFFEKRLRVALDYRSRILKNATCFRLINSESDQLSGLIIDVYEKAVLFQITSAGLEKRKTEIIEAIEAVLRPEILIERNDVSNREFEGLEQIHKVHRNQTDQSLEAYWVQLGPLNLKLNLIEGNKTGLYLDQIQNHQKATEWMERFSSKRVLDCFSYIGGFALNAARLESVETVLGVDQSAAWCALANEHAELNHLARKCHFEKANVFEWLREHSADTMPDQSFDAIILDPPSFTKNRHAVEGAVRGYRELHIRALKLLQSGGVLFTYSCSHHISDDLMRSIVFESACDTRTEVVEVDCHRQSPDHPVIPAIPESYYLKGFVYIKR